LSNKQVCLIDYKGLNSYLARMDDSAVDRLYRAFGNQMRAQRDLCEMTQEQLGELIGLSRTSITNIERGRQHVSLHHIFAIAEALKISPAALLPPSEITTNTEELDLSFLPGNDADIAEWIKQVARK
jgi:transcriptional regulator with XRE-family HTH domain